MATIEIKPKRHRSSRRHRASRIKAELARKAEPSKAAPADGQAALAWERRPPAQLAKPKA